MIRTKTTHNFLNNDLTTWEKSSTHFARYRAIGNLIMKYDICELLDLGCGKGIVEYLLPDHVSCLGYDFNTKYINIAKRLNEKKKNRKFKACNINLLQTHRKFEAILISEVLEEIESDLKMLKKSVSLLKDNGILILTVPNIQRLTNLLTGKFRYMDDFHLREYTISDAKSLLQKLGLKVVKVRGIGLQLPKEKYLPLFVRSMLRLSVDIILLTFPFLADHILIEARKTV